MHHDYVHSPCTNLNTTSQCWISNMLRVSTLDVKKEPWDALRVFKKQGCSENAGFDQNPTCKLRKLVGHAKCSFLCISCSSTRVSCSSFVVRRSRDLSYTWEKKSRIWPNHDDVYDDVKIQNFDSRLIKTLWNRRCMWSGSRLCVKSNATSLRRLFAISPRCNEKRLKSIKYDYIN
jgi:hypothetical protein